MCVISNLAYTLFQFAHFLNSADRFFHARILLNIFIFYGHFLGFKKLAKLKSEKFVRDQPSPSIIQISFDSVTWPISDMPNAFFKVGCVKLVPRYCSQMLTFR